MKMYTAPALLRVRTVFTVQSLQTPHDFQQRKKVQKKDATLQLRLF